MSWSIHPRWIAPTARAFARGGDVATGAVVALIALISTLTYVGRLGFTSDDFAFLSQMQLAQNRSVIALFQDGAENPNIVGRPVQNIVQVSLYTVFGTDPLGYHVFASALVIAMAVLCWLALRELGVPAAMSFAIAVAFSVSPAYATDRFWFAAFGYLVTMVAYFGNLYAELRAVRKRALHWPWKLAALVALATCVLAYEVAIPLLVLNLALVGWRMAKLAGGRVWITNAYGRLATAASFLSSAVVLGFCVAFKREHAVGYIGFGGLLTQVKTLIVAAVGVQFGSFGVLLPDTVFWAAHHASAGSFLVAAVVGVLVMWWMRRLLVMRAPRPKEWGALVAGGVLVFAGGWAIFLTNDRYTVTSTGIANRVGVAGALGAAMVLVGLLGLAASAIPRQGRSSLLGALLISALCTSFVLVTATVSDFWVRAHDRQEEILAALTPIVADRGKGQVVLLNGVCPYEGPAVVFESNWDLKGALQLRLHDQSLQADIVTRNLSLAEGGIQTTLYGSITKSYLYGPSTLLVTLPQDNIQALTNEKSARRALAASGFSPARDCPAGKEGLGVIQLRLDQVLKRYGNW